MLGRRPPTDHAAQIKQESQTALLAEAARQLGGDWQCRYTVVGTDWRCRLTRYVEKGCRCVGWSSACFLSTTRRASTGIIFAGYAGSYPQRRAPNVGTTRLNVPGMTALVVVAVPLVHRRGVSSRRLRGSRLSTCAALIAGRRSIDTGAVWCLPLTCKRSQLKCTLATFPVDGVEAFPSLGYSVHVCWSFDSMIHENKKSA